MAEFWFKKSVHALLGLLQVSSIMTSGLTAYLDTVTGEEHIFRKGDFYVIEPGVVYAQKSDPNTEILFIKVPPGNDKVPVDITPEVQAWFEKSIQE